jgi:D-cysteine desulfhydrase
MQIEKLPRYRLAQLPTLVEKLERLSTELRGPRLLIKRDDQTGLALGGNKTRKLEFLTGHALEQGADTLVTTGAAQSNHCRQTAAAAARAGLKCELILSGEPPVVPQGNLLLDHLLGAKVHWAKRSERDSKLREVSEQLRAQGRKPYVFGVGGSNGVGATGYVLAMMELMEQLRANQEKVDHIVFASSSGGTQAGMVVGAQIAGFTGGLHGISIDKGEVKLDSYEEEIALIANDCARYIDFDSRFGRQNMNVAYGYLGGGYGVVADLEREAIRLMARLEGIILDPVYTGRAFGGLLNLIRQGVFHRGETVLFWHTGGAPALFAYATDLADPPA